MLDTIAFYQSHLKGNQMTILEKTLQTLGEARPTIGVNEDDIQAGWYSASPATNGAGGFRSFPTTANKGYMRWYASDNAGAYTVSCTNASFGQSTVLTIQDPGDTTANFTLDQGIISAGTGSDSPGSLTGVTETLTIILAGVTYYVPLYAVNS